MCDVRLEWRSCAQETKHRRNRNDYIVETLVAQQVQGHVGHLGRVLVTRRQVVLRRYVDQSASRVSISQRRAHVWPWVGCARSKALHR